jgi:sec-independent protein translocase protein TatC
MGPPHFDPAAAEEYAVRKSRERDDTEPDAPKEDAPMTVLEHLGELRKRVMLAVAGLVPGMALAWTLRDPLLEFLVAPLVAAMRKLGAAAPALHYANPMDPFVAYFKISVGVGIVLSAPWTLWQVWAFVSPALYRREKLYAIPFIFASALFFVGGAFFGYAFVFPVGFEMLMGIAGPLDSVNVQPTIMIDEYLGFATTMLIAFGVVFEVPVVVSFLAAIKVVDWKQLLAFSRWWVVIASVLAALLTPSPDVGSMLLMLAPLVGLYFLSIGVAYLIGPKPPSPDEPESPENGHAGAA